MMLSWEYPPLTVGGAAAQVDGLASAFAAGGHEVVVLTRSTPGTADDTEVAGVRVLRADAHMPWIEGPDGRKGIAQVASANHGLVNLCTPLGDWTPEVVHAHDWQVAWAADVCARRWAVPLVTTFHGIERSRHGGHLPPGEAADVNSVEWWLAFRSHQIIAPTRVLAREIAAGFELDPELITRIPNAIDPGWWAGPPRPQVEHTAEGPMVLTWGRVQFEKGFQVLARAMTLLRSRVPGITCVIAGRGSYIPELQSQIDIEGVSDIVTLMGYVSDQELRDLIHQSSCVVIPSLYEPFGVVALEAMAGGAAVVLSETGGLAELAAGTGAAAMCEPGNTAELADRIAEVVTEPERAREMRRRAAELLESTYTWGATAHRTLEVYEAALHAP